MLRSKSQSLRFNWPFVVVLILLLGLGLVNLYSASTNQQGEMSKVFVSQLIFTGIGILFIACLNLLHYRIFREFAFWFYLIGVVLLALVPFFGKEFGGQRNWLVIGSFRLQPSELAKLATIFYLSDFMARYPFPTKQKLKHYLMPVGIIALPLLLILIERDLGSAIVFIVIGWAFLFLAGVKKRILLLACVLMVLGGGLAHRYFLSDNQKTRIQAFLHPEQDPQKSGYHLLKSKLAVGSGGLTGKGYLQGELNKLKFLPERHTDFVFPVLAEEWGFVGVSVVLLLFLTFFFLLLKMSSKAEDPFAQLFTQGVAVWFFAQCLLNLGGVLGLVPIAGVTLPFFSYGGSATFANFLALGLVLNMHARRYVFR